MPAATKGAEDKAKARILAAAAAVFAREGFAGARVDAIASEAGVNKALLYYHVGNKAELYEAVLLGWMDVLFSALRERVPAEAGPEEKLAALAATFEDLVRKHHEYPQILVREFSSGGQNLTGAVLGRLIALFEFERAILEEGKCAGVFRPASPVTVHLLLVVGTVMHLMGRQLIERSAQLGLSPVPELPRSPSGAVLDLLLDGLRAKRPGRSPARGPRGKGKGGRRQPHPARTNTRIKEDTR